MCNRLFTLTSTACWSALLATSAVPARADYGVTTKHPLSNPSQAKIDEDVAGTWHIVIKGKTYYLHVGAGNIVGQLNWTELVLVNPGDTKPSFYMHHLIGFPTTIGGESYFNVAHMSRLIPQLRGSKIEQLVSSVERFEIMKYQLTGDHLDIWSADQKLIAEAIAAGRIKGSGGQIDDTPKNVIQFIQSSAPKLFPNKFRYTRVKEPESPPPAEGATAPTAPVAPKTSTTPPAPKASTTPGAPKPQKSPLGAEKARPHRVDVVITTTKRTRSSPRSPAA